MNFSDIESLVTTPPDPKEEILISNVENPTNLTSDVKLWYRIDKNNLFYRNERNAFKEILPASYVTSIAPSEEEGYLTIYDSHGSYEVEVGSSLAFTSSGAANTASFTVTQNGTPQTVYTNGLPVSGGTVTGAVTFSNTTDASTTATGAVRISGGLGVAKNIYGNQVHGAVWNDYAEYRHSETLLPGYCIHDNPHGIMTKTTRRLQPACKIVSDTFGFAIGQTDKCRTPTAVSGRVLAIPYEERETYEIGDCVCSGPGGTVSKMTREEIINYPDRIVGIVSEIPNYDIWGKDDIQVNGRIWIYVR